MKVEPAPELRPFINVWIKYCDSLPKGADDVDYLQGEVPCRRRPAGSNESAVRESGPSDGNLDPGLIPIYDRSGRMQPSKALETAVFIELLRRGAEIGYVRTPDGLEIDFLARWPDGSEELIQVCAEIIDGTTLERELRALTAASEFHPRAGLSIVTMFPDGFNDVPNRVQVRDAAIWLTL